MKDKQIKIIGGLVILFFLYKKFFTKSNTIEVVNNITDTIILKSAKFHYFVNKNNKLRPWINEPKIEISINTTADIELKENNGKLKCNLFFGSTPNIGWYFMNIPIQSSNILKKGTYILTYPGTLLAQNKDTLNGNIFIGDQILKIDKLPITGLPYAP